MKIFLLAMLILSKPGFAIETIWEVSEGISAPESAYYEPISGKIFVSSIVGAGTEKDKKGHISIIDEKGNIVEKNWIDGLNAPKGMRAYKGVLWVSDIDEVLVINIKKRKIVDRIKIAGAKFLNDIVISEKGDVYVSDSITTTIHKITNYKPEVFVTGDKYTSPNGLLISNGKLIVASWGLTTDWSTKILGKVYSIDLNSKKMEMISKAPLGNLDGIELRTENSFIVSDWVSGKIYKVNLNGKSELIYTGEKGYADIGFIKEKGILVIPIMTKNKVIALKI